MTQSSVIVVDTNVWMDYLIGERQGNKAAVGFLGEAIRLETSLVIAPHSMSDVFFLFQQYLKARNRADGKQTSEAAAASARSAAWAVVDLIMELASVGPSDHMDTLMASRHRGVHGDYEDNLVIACAMRTNARLLVTNDEQLIKHSPVPTLCAEDAMNLLSTE